MNIDLLQRAGHYVVVKTRLNGPFIYLNHFSDKDEAISFGEIEGKKLPIVEDTTQEWVQILQPHPEHRILLCGPVLLF